MTTRWNTNKPFESSITSNISNCRLPQEPTASFNHIESGTRSDVRCNRLLKKQTYMVKMLTQWKHRYVSLPQFAYLYFFKGKFMQCILEIMTVSQKSYQKEYYTKSNRIPELSSLPPVVQLRGIKKFQ